MKIKTLVVAPYAGLAELTTSLKTDLDEFDITVVQGDLSEVLPLIERIHLEGYHLIISRGGTARLLSKHSYLPVIDIQVSGFDILRLLTLVKGYQSRIEMIGFQNVIEGIISVSSLMNMDISYTIIHHQDEVDHALQTAKAKGVKIIVGDNITVKLAAGYSMQGVLITSGRESVLAAFTQAKQIYKISKTYNIKNHAFETLLGTMEMGYAIVDQNGTVKFANSAFRGFLKLSSTESNLFEEYPYLKRLIGDLDKGITLDLHMMMFDQEGQFALAGDEIPNETENKLYYLKVRPANQVDCEIRLSYSTEINKAFPQLIMTQSAYAEGQAACRFPMALYGERGVGKRLFALGAVLNNTDNMLEIEILKSSEASFRALLALISACNKEQILFIRGVENLSVKEQKELSVGFQKSKGRVICSFIQAPAILIERKQLDTKLYEVFKNQIVFIAPLRERRKDLEEYIHTFLISFNEKYGKQIVGIRPEVAEALYQHPWKNNLFELKEIMEQFVLHTMGEYMDTNVLSLLQSQKQNSTKQNFLDPLNTGLNLYQTLDDIEKDIIRIVLEQEDMNQSLAAKRLGINRSTLWRKLKE